MAASGVAAASTDHPCAAALHGWSSVLNLAARANDTIHADVAARKFADLATFATPAGRADALTRQFVSAHAAVKHACW